MLPKHTYKCKIFHYIPSILFISEPYIEGRWGKIICSYTNKHMFTYQQINVKKGGMYGIAAALHCLYVTVYHSMEKITILRQNKLNLFLPSTDQSVQR